MLTGLHPRFVLAGHLVKIGAVVSTNVMVWTHVAELVQASVALHVRVIIFGQVPLVTSLWVVTGLSAASSLFVVVPLLGMLVGWHHWFVLVVRLVISGIVVSATVIVWSHVAMLVQASVALHVRVI